MIRAFVAEAVVLLFALLASATPAPKDPKMDLDFHRKVPSSDLKIELSSAANATRTKQGLVLPLKIANASADEIKTTLAHEWHGGEWPTTALYASVTPETDKDPKPFSPVYLVGEDQAAPRPVTLAAGMAIDLDLRMDWPGTGSKRAVPLIKAPGKYAVRFLLVIEASGKQQYVVTTPKVVELLAE
jgi:hypothetical protein